MNILAIDPSSTCIGYALFKDDALYKSGFKFIKGNTLSDKLELIKQFVDEELSNMILISDVVVVEVNISAYSKNIKYINKYQFVTGYLVGIIRDYTKNIQLVAVSDWKKTKTEEEVSYYAKVYYGVNTKNRDELTAVWLGHCYINELKLLKLSQ